MYFDNTQIAVVYCKEYTLYCYIKFNGEIRYTKESINSTGMMELRKLEALENQLEEPEIIIFDIDLDAL
jgi:hypothetical protein